MFCRGNNTSYTSHVIPYMFRRGSNDADQLNVPQAAISNVTVIAVGFVHNCLLRKSGATLKLLNPTPHPHLSVSKPFPMQLLFPARIRMSYFSFNFNMFRIEYIVLHVQTQARLLSA